MARTWLSITVELVEGRGGSFWPRPGRVFAASRSHTFTDLATATDDAFARWDRSHLHEFRLADETRLGEPEHDWGEPDSMLDDRPETSRTNTLPPLNSAHNATAQDPSANSA